MRKYATLFLYQIFLQLLAFVLSGDDCSKMHEPKLLRSCCKIPYTDEVIKNCSAKLKTLRHNDTGHLENQKNKVEFHICVAECELKAKGYLVSSDAVNTNAIDKDLSQRYPNDRDYVRLFLGSLTNCSTFAQKKSKEIKSWLKTSDRCNVFPSILLGCIYEQIISQCPEKRWHSTPKCDELQIFLQKCDILKSDQI